MNQPVPAALRTDSHIRADLFLANRPVRWQATADSLLYIVVIYLARLFCNSRVIMPLRNRIFREHLQRQGLVAAQ